LGIKLDVDAMHFGNETRFINDYTGLAPTPNVSFTTYRNPCSGEVSTRAHEPGSLAARARPVAAPGSLAAPLHRCATAPPHRCAAAPPLRHCGGHARPSLARV